jgi:hypothetical protein
MQSNSRGHGICLASSEIALNDGMAGALCNPGLHIMVVWPKPASSRTACNEGIPYVLQAQKLHAMTAGHMSLKLQNCM